MSGIIKEAVSRVVMQLYHTVVPPESILVQETPEHVEGDFTILIFPLTKISRKSPEDTGNEIAGPLQTACPDIRSVEMLKGFMNLTMHDTFWIRFYKEASHREKFGFTLASGKEKPVLIEFSSPNTNKPLHLGHIRNNLIGFSVAAILEASGKQVIRVNLVNDRGIHICKSMLGWMKFGKGMTPVLAGIKGDKFVGDFYVAFEKAYRKETEAAVRSGIPAEEADKASRLMEEARDILRYWEDGEPQTLALWRQMNTWVYEGFDITYKRLGIHFDKEYYESDTYLKGKEMVMKGVGEGLLSRREDGSVWIDLTAEGMDEKLLLRSDGTSVYITQDIGTAMIRDEEFDPSVMIYVVGNEQNYHFEVLKRVLKKLDYLFYKKIRHLSYGMVELPSGKMKSREGTVVDADDLMEEMHQTAALVTTALGKWNEDELKELDDLFEILGTGALKYFILKVDPRKNMLFNPEESIDFNGHTGPFIQYTHARISSLMRKAEEQELMVSSESVGDHYTLEKQERSLLQTLFQWPEVLTESAKELNPALVANYCYRLAREFNQFYHVLSVLSAENGEKIAFRTGLSSFTGKVLCDAMGLLGITLPDKM